MDEMNSWEALDIGNSWGEHGKNQIANKHEINPKQSIW